MTDTATDTTVHGPELGGRCRCGFEPTIPDGTSDADAIAMAVDQRAEHYADVGYEPPDPTHVPTRQAGPANRIPTAEELASIGAALPAVVERAAAVAAAAGRIGAEDETDEAEVRRQRFDRAWDAFRPTAMFDGADLADLAPDARAEADRWLADPTGNLIIRSDHLGNGKSYMAIALCRALMLRGRSCRWGPVVEILDGLRPDGHLRVEDLTAPDYLLLDDIGADKPTEWTLERLYAVINRRWLERRPIIVTTNTPVDEIIANIGARAWDRLRDGATAIELEGGTRRKGKPAWPA